MYRNGENAVKLNGLNIAGAIFDMDGTLLDSMAAWYDAGSRYMRSLGMTPPPSLNHDLLRMTLAEAAAHMQALGVNKPVEEIHAGFNSVMDEFYACQVRARPGVPEFLARLSSAGVRICVATASDRYQVEMGLAHAGLARYIERIFTCTELHTGKHEPAIFNAAREFMGTDKSATWVFEDARHAACTAKNAGYRVCGVFDPSEPDQSGLRAAADVYVKSFEEFAQQNING